MAGMLVRIAGTGFRPGLIIDVGAANGIWSVYNAFRDVLPLLIEALEEFAPESRRICEIRLGRYVLAAAGVLTGRATICVHDRDLYGSSTYREVGGPSLDGVERQVPSVRLDDIVEPDVGSILLKVDVQGAELTVLDGARQTLDRIEAVLLERIEQPFGG